MHCEGSSACPLTAGFCSEGFSAYAVTVTCTVACKVTGTDGILVSGAGIKPARVDMVVAQRLPRRLHTDGAVTGTATSQPLHCTVTARWLHSDRPVMAQ